MPPSILVTEFAPAERQPIEIVRRQAERVSGLPWVSVMANSMLNVVMILNSHRQIVFVSDNAKQLFRDRDLDGLLGLRPGEAP